MNMEELNALPYRELQKRAKELKVKANQPKDALVKAIMSAADVKSVESPGANLNQTFEVPSKAQGSPGLNATFDLDEPSFLTNENTPPASAISKTPTPLRPTATHTPASGISKRSTPVSRKAATPLRPIATCTPSSRALHRTLPGNTSFNLKRKSSIVPKSVLKKAVGLTTPSALKLGSPGVTFKQTPGSTRSSKPAQSTFSSKLPRKKVPDFAKIHAEQFKKMDTLEGYLQKKQERIARVLTPGKSLVQNDRPERKSPKIPVAKALTERKSPRIPAAKPLTERSTVDARRPLAHAANVSLVTTRKQPNLSVSQTSFNFGNSTTSQANNVFMFNAKPSSTPSKRLNVTQPSGTPGSASKKFDAKASIASKRPLAYQPYSGKLKPWNPAKKLEERKMMAAKTRPSVKSDQLRIRGVRLNRRVELMLQKRNI